MSSVLVALASVFLVVGLIYLWALLVLKNKPSSREITELNTRRAIHLYMELAPKRGEMFRIKNHPFYDGLIGTAVHVDDEGRVKLNLKYPLEDSVWTTCDHLERI